MEILIKTRKYLISSLMNRGILVSLFFSNEVGQSLVLACFYGTFEGEGEPFLKFGGKLVMKDKLMLGSLSYLSLTTRTFNAVSTFRQNACLLLLFDLGAFKHLRILKGHCYHYTFSIDIAACIA